MRVRLLDEKGKPLKTLGNPEAKPITGNVLAEEVRWKKSLHALRAKPVRLEFQLREAKLFGFAFHSTGV